MILSIFFVSWLIFTILCYLTMPVFAISISGGFKLVYSIVAAWFMAFILTVIVAILKGYRPGDSYGLESDLTGKTFPANRFVKGIASGGKLTFHNDYMEFIPHSINVNTDNARFYYKDISRAEDVPMINNLKLIFKDGHEEHLVMNRKKEKIEYINRKQR